ncbi:hypothetical protein I7I48_09934 [Histoplasma ohiense]|nr:hypothetical protein I7I48_09934 [Histoplasma ohiense (nom. inval.)]
MQVVGKISDPERRGGSRWRKDVQKGSLPFTQTPYISRDYMKLAFGRSCARGLGRRSKRTKFPLRKERQASNLGLGPDLTLKRKKEKEKRNKMEPAFDWSNFQYQFQARHQIGTSRTVTFSKAISWMLNWSICGQQIRSMRSTTIEWRWQHYVNSHPGHSVYQRAQKYIFCRVMDICGDIMSNSEQMHEV